MGWIIGILAVLAIGYFVLGKPTNSNNPKIQALVEEGKAEVHAERHRDAAHYDNYGKIMDLLDADKHRAALNLIEKTLDNPQFDQNDDIYAHDIADSFCSLMEEKSPQVVLNFYDKLKSEGAALAYAEKHGQLKEMAPALIDSLREYPDVKTKTALKKAVAFTQGNHPLIEAAIEVDAKSFMDFLDVQASLIFDEWDFGMSDDLEAMIKAIQSAMEDKPQEKPQINSNGLECSCKEWRTKRATLDTENPSRICRHLAAYFAAHPDEIPQKMQPYKDFITSRGEAGIDMPLPKKDSIMEYGVINNVPYILELQLNGTPWVNVRLAGGSKYGYSVQEHRWAKGDEPQNAKELAQKALEFYPK